MTEAYNTQTQKASAVTGNLYLEPNPNTTSRGYNIGKLPSTIPVSNLLALGQPTRPTKAIRAKCIDCCGGSNSEVRKCTAVDCPLWSMRMGKNPFYGQSIGNEKN